MQHITLAGDVCTVSLCVDSGLPVSPPAAQSSESGADEPGQGLDAGSSDADSQVRYKYHLHTHTHWCCSTLVLLANNCPWQIFHA